MEIGSDWVLTDFTAVMGITPKFLKQSHDFLL